MSHTFATAFLKEVEAEASATRKCIERIPESTFEFKPHAKSMKMGYLTLLVAEIPLWIKYMVETGEIDFVTFPHAQPKTTGEMARLCIPHQKFKTSVQRSIIGYKTAGSLLFVCV